MIKVSQEWNKKQSLLKDYLSSKGDIKKAIELCIDMHSMLHSSKVCNTKAKTYDDFLWDGMTEDIFRVIPQKKNATIAWNIWHIARIEDLTTTILILNEKQSFDNSWMKKIKTNVKDTGNAMTRDEIKLFTDRIDMNELRNYRTAVGKRTQNILINLSKENIHQKVEKERLNRILKEGGVLDEEESKWLLDFWGKKTIAGLILMPITRHQVVHLNEAFRIKEKYKKILMKHNQ